MGRYPPGTIIVASLCGGFTVALRVAGAGLVINLAGALRQEEPADYPYLVKLQDRVDRGSFPMAPMAHLAFEV